MEKLSLFSCLTQMTSLGVKPSTRISFATHPKFDRSRYPIVCHDACNRMAELIGSVLDCLHLKEYPLIALPHTVRINTDDRRIEMPDLNSAYPENLIINLLHTDRELNLEPHSGESGRDLDNLIIVALKSNIGVLENIAGNLELIGARVHLIAVGRLDIPDEGYRWNQCGTVLAANHIYLKGKSTVFR